jgi:thioredoxin domain-containing protein 5
VGGDLFFSAGYTIMPKKSGNRVLWYAVAALLVAAAYATYRVTRACKETFTTSPQSFASDAGDGQKLVWFYADWCGHCKSMHSDWDGAADEVNNDDSVRMMKVNCGDTKKADHRQLSRKYNVTGYPTIMLLENGEVVSEYKDGRSQTDFVSYVRDNMS